MTVAWWDLTEGWVLRVEQRHSGPGPHSVASLERADQVRGQATYGWAPTYHWAPTEADGEAERQAEEQTAGEATALEMLEDILSTSSADRLELTRRGCMLAGVWWELDEFHGRLDGLILARSKGADAADPAVTAWWLGREVTAERAYDDRALAAHPRP